MHICHIITTFNSKAGSTSRTIKTIKASLKDGHQVSLIFGIANDLDISDLPEVKTYMIKTLEKRINIVNDIKSLYQVNAILNKIKPDIVHSHLAKAGAICRVFKFSNYKIIHTVHGPSFPSSLNFFKRSIYYLIEKKCSSNTDFFVFVGKELKNEYLNYNLCNTNNSIVIRTPQSKDNLTHEYKKERAKASKEIIGDLHADLILINIGRLVPSKNQKDSIKIVANLQKNGINTHLILIGAALLDKELEYEKELKQLVKSLQLEKKIHFLGHKSEIMPYLDISDIFVFTSKYEGLPNVIVESILSGTPVVTYLVNGVRELIPSELSYLIAPQGDTEKLTNTIINIYKNLHSINESFSNLQHQIRLLYDEDTLIEQKKLLYDKVYFSD